MSFLCCCCCCCYRTLGMDFGLIGEKCVCICTPLDFVPPVWSKKKNDIRYFSSKQQSWNCCSRFLRLASRAVSTAVDHVSAREQSSNCCWAENKALSLLAWSMTMNDIICPEWSFGSLEIGDSCSCRLSVQSSSDHLSAHGLAIER